MGLSKDYTKKLQVKEILLMPIVCNKYITKIVRRGNWIYTGQEYCNSADEDMSDFAVGFYKIIYRNVLKRDKENNCIILNKDKNFFDDNFAGDTMNSFNTIAKYYKKNSSDWPKCLWEYFEQYHCLANFWLVPKHIGRTSPRTPNELRKVSKSKNGINDYMDKFLIDYKENIDKYKTAYGDYFSKFKDFEDFATKHFLLESYYKLIEDKIIEYSDLSKYELEKIINSMKSRIEGRANNISNSELMIDFGGQKRAVWEALWEYFNQLNLIE